MPKTKKLLGAHILGEAGAENIHLAAAVLHYGNTIDYFIDAVFNYPTLSDAYKYAAYDGLGAFSRYHKRLRKPQAVGAGGGFPTIPVQGFSFVS